MVQNEIKVFQEMDIRELANIYDRESEDSFLSIFIDVTQRDWKGFVDKRLNSCLTALGGTTKLKNNLLKTYENLIERMAHISHTSQERGLALFGSEKNSFYKIYQLPMAPDNLFVLDSSPFIKPLALLQDEWEEFILIFVDGTSASVYLLGARVIVDHKELEVDIMGRHKKGGWSQMRFNRNRKGTLKHFYKMVVDDLDELFERENISVVSIILAGPGNAKKELKEILPQAYRERISHILDIDSHVTLSELIRSTTEIIHQDEKKASLDSVNLLRSLILSDGPATYGIDNVVEASRNGAVKTLLIHKNTSIPGWICEKCQAVENGTSPKCPYCEGKTSRVEMAEEILEFVYRNNGAVEFVDHSPYLDGLGGVAAILRY